MSREDSTDAISTEIQLHPTTATIAASTDTTTARHGDAALAAVGSDSHREGDERPNRDAATQTGREMCFEGLGKRSCTLLKTLGSWFCWLALTLFVIIAMVPCFFIVMIADVDIGTGAAYTDIETPTPKEHAEPADFQEQLIKRQCIAVETCKSDAIVPKAWGDNALANHLSEDSVYLPMSRDDITEEYSCYLFSAPLSIVRIEEPVTTKEDVTDCVNSTSPLQPELLPIHLRCKGAEETKAKGQDVPSEPDLDSENDVEIRAKVDTTDIEAFSSETTDCVDVTIRNSACLSPTCDGSARQLAAECDNTVNNTSSPTNQQKEPTATSRETKAFCDICLTDFRVGAYVAWSNNANCRHAFHVHCILDWLLQHPTCPSCRQDYIIQVPL